jgi:hypothetical protein
MQQISDNIVEESKEIKTYMSAIKRFPQKLDSKVGQAMFVRSLEQKMRREGTFDKVENVKNDAIIQQAMKENYVKFVKRINGME